MADGLENASQHLDSQKPRWSQRLMAWVKTVARTFGPFAEGHGGHVILHL
jgi:hypothetical protein